MGLQGEVVARRPVDRSRIVVACAGAFGLALLAHSALASSATYDESAYLRIASTWWRTGDAAEIARMGSPVTFFKLQVGPSFALLDAAGRGDLIDAAVDREATLLPIVRIGSLWIWLLAFALTVAWSRRLYGPAASSLAAWLFALSPNLLAHGALVTMEMPLVAATSAVFALFWIWRESGRRWAFAASAAACGVAFSCKFTSVVYPAILGLIWAVDERRAGVRSIGRLASRVCLGMACYGMILVAADLVVTGFATIPASQRSGEHPSVPGPLGLWLEASWPHDWVAFANQVRHQRGGGPSYLLGERRMTGWWYYYPVALAVKVPFGCWLLIGARWISALRQRAARQDWALPLSIAAFLALAMLGSRRNYGVRYLLPMAPLAIVWVSGLASRTSAWRRVVWLGLLAQAAALASIHPHELTYFNELAGGPIGGRKVLADSNLDWGQGVRSLARLEASYGLMTVFYFGDTDPARYGIRSNTYRFDAHTVRPELPRRGGVPALASTTRFIAVSASLQHGPWGPAGLFRPLDGLEPAAYSDDTTIAVYDLAGRPDLYEPGR